MCFLLVEARCAAFPSVYCLQAGDSCYEILLLVVETMMYVSFSWHGAIYCFNDNILLERVQISSEWVAVFG